MGITKPATIVSIPQKPGVYLFKNATGDTLYIGKAIRLQSRVASYFHTTPSHAPHKQLMVPKIKKVEYIITSSETEALLLESNLIKKHQPPYNIDLKDDKNFQYIKITTTEEFPRVFTVRNVLKDKNKYFGPYVSGSSVKQTLQLLRKLFPHRNFPKAPSRQHIKYLIDRYPNLHGPRDPNEYQKTIERIIDFLHGHYGDIQKGLTSQMAAASEKHEYEKAATIRDKIQAIQRLSEKQKVVTVKTENMDIVSVATEHTTSVINVFRIRNGKLIDKQNLILRHAADDEPSSVVQAFVQQYYTHVTDIPSTIVLPIVLPNTKTIEKTFCVKILVPQRGHKKQLLKLGHENASAYLTQQKESWERDETMIKKALEELRRHVLLSKPPQRIEIFDISNIQGTNAAGSMVVFINGKPTKKWYRKFKIKTISGSNDTAMMAEVLSRRFNHQQLEDPEQSRVATTKWPKPDLIILDGGKGQLNAVLKTIKQRIPVIAIAKRNEDLYLPQRKNPINLPTHSPALHLIQRMRDEAHRFAITFYRKIHEKKSQKSILDDIPGIGPIMKQRLLTTFGSVVGIQNATQKELAKIAGSKRAQLIREYIRPYQMPNMPRK